MPKAAFLYDFDGTLSPGNMQEYAFIPQLSKTREDFWREAEELTKKNKMDGILAYMHLMLKEASYHGVSVRREDLVACGNKIAFFPGVENWFSRTRAEAEKRGIELEHFILSSGLAEIIEGTAIAGEFKQIYASRFLYDPNDVPIWPAQAINFTSKTQFLFRINKGALDITDTLTLNSYMAEADRAVPFSNMAYFGDGFTDVPSMKLTNQYGGHSVAVYEEKTEQKETALRLQQEKRADYIAPADYRPESRLFTIALAILDKIAADDTCKRLRKQPV